MPKFTFIAEHEGGERITFETHKEFIDEVLDDFNLFLRGVGFFPKDGRLDYVNDEQEQSLDDWTRVRIEEAAAEGGDYHSKYYFDTERNK